jgi:hypothetical protein
MNILQLVEQTVKQQNLQGDALRSTSRTLLTDADLDPKDAMAGWLGEVKALNPNHEGRLEAIARAEKARQKDLQSRPKMPLQHEIENFSEAGKLRKTGGADEVERRRLIADEKARKENWERAEQRKIEIEKKKAEKARLAAEEAKREQERRATGGAEQEGNDTSQEGEAAFQDAPESTEGVIEEKPPTPPAKDGQDRNSGPPQLPMIGTGLGIEDGDGKEKNVNGTSFFGE